MPAVEMAERCNWCSKQRPGFRIHKLASGQAICDHCLEWHTKAMQFLGGAPPSGCQECGSTWADLTSAVPSALDVRIYIVQKDGIYQMLCERCVVPYVKKREDLYGGTKFWRETN